MSRQRKPDRSSELSSPSGASSQSNSMFDWADEKTAEIRRRLDGTLLSFHHLERTYDQGKHLEEDNEMQDMSLFEQTKSTSGSTMPHHSTYSKNSVEIRPLPHAESVYLSGLSLDRFPRSLLPTQMAFLRDLYLDHNNLTSFDFGDAPAMRSLRLLNLKFNRITTLPESLTSLSNLQFLYLDNNQLTSLPRSLKDLKSLQVLSASNNRIRELPEEIGNCTKLENLNLASNDLTLLPSSMQHLTSLSILRLEGNPSLRLSKLSLNLPNLFHMSVEVNGEVKVFTKTETMNEVLNLTPMCSICKKRQKNSACALNACKKCCLSTKVQCFVHGTGKSASTGPKNSNSTTTTTTTTTTTSNTSNTVMTDRVQGFSGSESSAVANSSTLKRQRTPDPVVIDVDLWDEQQQQQQQQTAQPLTQQQLPQSALQRVQQTSQAFISSPMNSSTLVKQNIDLPAPKRRKRGIATIRERDR